MKQLLALIIFVSFGFGVEFNLPLTRTLILSEANGVAEIVDSDKFVLGSSGIVTHKFSGGLKSIVARAVVIEKKSGFAKIRFELFDFLKQPALPLPNFLPRQGDEVTLNYLYDRALIIAPNEEIYKEIVNAFPNISFIHPDIAGAYLSKNYKPNPSRDDFRKICAQNAAGLIFLALNSEAMFLDCGSFSVLKKFQSRTISYYHLPFWSHVGEIDTVFWDFDSAKINNYDRYYKNLIK